ncbi:chorismate mutase [Actinomadura oligospora]|uniref:chorismate mutase n=1 Tax=Actinomadura oligospora TaxID=111804 RepID=UPI000479C7DE|nr:chorismate mutase [Actinomadura oligospora]
MSDPTSLVEVRARIDALDGDLVRLLAERQALVRRAAAFKIDEQAVRAPGRVEQVVQAARERAAGAGLSPSVADAVWRAMIAAFIDLELDEHRAGASSDTDRDGER